MLRLIYISSFNDSKNIIPLQCCTGALLHIKLFALYWIPPKKCFSTKEFQVYTFSFFFCDGLRTVSIGIRKKFWNIELFSFHCNFQNCYRNIIHMSFIVSMVLYLGGALHAGSSKIESRNTAKGSIGSWSTQSRKYLKQKAVGLEKTGNNKYSKWTVLFTNSFF